MKVRPNSKRQSGVMLLEALIAILIFAIGILGIVGLQATGIKQGTDAKYRSDAAFLANQLIGAMWLGDRSFATLTKYSTGGGAPYTAWSATVGTTLPNAGGGVGVNDKPPTVAVAADGTVTISIFWLAPSEPANTTHHRYVTTAQIKDVSN